ncbi:Uncharacterised protein [Bordetella pertussis]|nr:Uncharacterised protein [Bordetella pertussis]
MAIRSQVRKMGTFIGIVTVCYLTGAAGGCQPCSAS